LNVQFETIYSLNQNNFIIHESYISNQVLSKMPTSSFGRCVRNKIQIRLSQFRGIWFLTKRCNLFKWINYEPNWSWTVYSNFTVSGFDEVRKKW